MHMKRENVDTEIEKGESSFTKREGGREMRRESDIDRQITKEKRGQRPKRMKRKREGERWREEAKVIERKMKRERGENIAKK
jgi:hypothetical protein